jgi:hypothetical protein
MISYRGILGNCPEILDSSRQLFEIFDQFGPFSPTAILAAKIISKKLAWSYCIKLADS